MPHTTREREGFVTYHDDFESVSGDDIERQMAINTNAFLIGKHYPSEQPSCSYRGQRNSVSDECH
jgi:hypothetical protein